MLRKTIKTAFSLIFLATAATVLFLSTPGGNKFLTKHLTTYLEEYTDLVIEVDKLSWNFPLDLAVTQLRIRNKDGVELATAREAMATMALRQLLRGELQIHQIVLRDGRIGGIATSIDITAAGWLDSARQMLSVQAYVSQHGGAAAGSSGITNISLSAARSSDGKIVLHGAVEAPSAGLLATLLPEPLPAPLPSTYKIKLFFNAIVALPNATASGSFEAAVIAQNPSADASEVFPAIKGIFSLQEQGPINVSSILSMHYQGTPIDIQSDCLWTPQTNAFDVEYLAILAPPFAAIATGSWNGTEQHSPFSLDLLAPLPAHIAGSWQIIDREFLHVTAQEASIAYPSMPIMNQGTLDIEVSSGHLALAPIQWNLGKSGATLTMSGDFTADNQQAHAELKLLPLSMLAKVIPTLLPYSDLEGMVSATLAWGGSWPAPHGQLDLTSEGLAFGGNIALPLGLLQSDLHLTLADSAITGNAAILGLLAEQPLAFKAVVPIVVGGAFGDIALDRTSPILASLTGAGDLTPFLELIAPDRVDLSAQGRMKVDLQGSLDQPDLSGGLSLRRGRFEDFDSGTLLLDISGDIVAQGGKISLKNIHANDGKGGSVTGYGTMDLSGHDDIKTLFDLDLDVQNFAIVRLDNAAVSATGNLKLSGDEKALLLSGAIVAEPVEITIPDQLPPSVVTIDISWANGKGAPPPLPPKKKGIPIYYDVKISISPHAKIVGKNLASTWKGKLELIGDSDNPELFGDIKLVNGSYDFKGKPFTLSQGLITFAGDIGKKSSLNLIASQQMDNVKIEIVLHGPLKDPEVSFRSNPPLTRREILSRLLFGKSSTDISPLEDTQLSQSLSSLSSQQADDSMLDKLRNAVPFDRIHIDFTSGINQSSDTLSVGVGKYIYKGVLISVKRDIARDSTGGGGGAAADSDGGDRSRFGVEADLMRNVKLQAEIDDSSKTEFILKWQHDY